MDHSNDHYLKKKGADQQWRRPHGIISHVYLSLYTYTHTLNTTPVEREKERREEEEEEEEERGRKRGERELGKLNLS